MTKPLLKDLKLTSRNTSTTNTIGRDLWNALSDASGKDVSSFMDTWLEQPGYPVVTAEVVDDTLILSQKQFFIGEHEDKGRLWEIPLNTNWKGLPDTLSEERIEIPIIASLLLKIKELFALIQQIRHITSQTTKDNSWTNS